MSERLVLCRSCGSFQSIQKGEFMAPKEHFLIQLLDAQRVATWRWWLQNLPIVIRTLKKMRSGRYECMIISAESVHTVSKKEFERLTEGSRRYIKAKAKEITNAIEQKMDEIVTDAVIHHTSPTDN